MCVVSEVLYGTGIDCVLQIQFEYDCEHKLPHHAKPTIQKFHSQEEAPWNKTLAEPNPGKKGVFSFKSLGPIHPKCQVSSFKQVLWRKCPPPNRPFWLETCICIASVCYPLSSTAEEVCTIKESFVSCQKSFRFTASGSMFMFSLKHSVAGPVDAWILRCWSSLPSVGQHFGRGLTNSGSPCSWWMIISMVWHHSWNGPLQGKLKLLHWLL